MAELSKSQRARHAIRAFKILADFLPLRGMYHPSGTTGKKLADALMQLAPEIYGSMPDPRITELKGLEYVIDRMPRGIEKCRRIVFTGQEDFAETSFEKIVPLRRRRVSYAVSDTELCFVLTTGTSEIYDILSHLTFLNIEAEKIYARITSLKTGKSAEWQQLEEMMTAEEGPDTILSDEGQLEKALWNLSIILGRTYKETAETYQFLEQSRLESNANSGLFAIIYGIVSRVFAEKESGQEQLAVSFTPSLYDMINHQKYACIWGEQLKKRLGKLGLLSRPLHIVSANMHSMRNTIYGAGALAAAGQDVPDDMTEMARRLRSQSELVEEYAAKHGYTFIKDISGSEIDGHIIDLARVDMKALHPSLRSSLQEKCGEERCSNNDADKSEENKPVIIVIDYAFGTQAFDIMDQLLEPLADGKSLSIESISIMGKAGILPGNKGDIMLATSHVVEGTGHCYTFENDISAADFPQDAAVFSGAMLTVLGTSLQNGYVLERFHSSDWRAIGLEMEGGHYQRAIAKAIIQQRISPEIKLRYAYYASDNPMISGQTLASGPMGEDGIYPTYLISKVLFEKICCG